MKKNILFTILLFALFFTSNAQNSLILNINHKLGDSEFTVNDSAKNNLDHDFKVTRLEYYISEISLVHDGGNETLIENLWALVDAASPSEIELGDFDINNVEKIRFHIGVDPDHNHLDPSSWHSSHPLSPKFPSMHWGWTAGYRFVALEGNGGPDFNQLVQLHGLGDANYFMTEIDLDLVAADNVLTINLDADYTKALEDIAVNAGVIVHGENFQAKQCLENFRDYVFSPASITSSSIDFREVTKFNLFPNPIENGFTTLILELKDSNYKYDLSITSLDGKQLDYLYNVIDNQTVEFTNQLPGMYFINLIKEGQTIITKKVFVK